MRKCSREKDEKKRKKEFMIQYLKYMVKERKWKEEETPDGKSEQEKKKDKKDGNHHHSSIFASCFLMKNHFLT